MVSIEKQGLLTMPKCRLLAAFQVWAATVVVKVMRWIKGPLAHKSPVGFQYFNPWCDWPERGAPAM
jgi:hypothetical protein